VDLNEDGISVMTESGTAIRLAAACGMCRNAAGSLPYVLWKGEGRVGYLYPEGVSFKRDRDPRKGL